MLAQAVGQQVRIGGVSPQMRGDHLGAGERARRGGPFAVGVGAGLAAQRADDLRLQLKESVERNDLIIQTAKARELEHEQLVGGLIKEVERVNELILGK